MRVTVIVNPATRSSRPALKALLRQARERSARLRVAITTPEFPGARQAQQARKEGDDAVIVVGGDGTLRLVAQEIADSPVELGIMPAGTGNIFARNLGLCPGRHARNADIALGDAVRIADLGEAVIDGERQVFLSMLGVGRDAEVVQAVTQRPYHANHWGAYVLEGLKKLASGPMPCVINGFRVDVWTVLIGNVPRIPLGVRVFPNVEVDSRDFELLFVGQPKLSQWVAIAAQGCGLRRNAPQLAWQRLTHATISFPQPRLIHLDGDTVADVQRIHVDLRPSALQVRVAR